MRLTQREKEILFWELNQGKRGDNDAYDKKIDKIIQKLEEILR